MQGHAPCSMLVNLSEQSRQFTGNLGLSGCGLVIGCLVLGRSRTVKPFPFGRRPNQKQRRSEKGGSFCLSLGRFLLHASCNLRRTESLFCSSVTEHKHKNTEESTCAQCSKFTARVLSVRDTLFSQNLSLLAAILDADRQGEEDWGSMKRRAGEKVQKAQRWLASLNAAGL